ncbi:hypothetical protein M1247_35110 [Mycobacterium sp. 21AC1]|uniref:hypothetical protein n=1 Tax=[Mycobacterium] appelbergii TaxID=2939269 RepID=UPI0029395210|nr:hypothetical protein [Mycobacterium sp. 21AC1]MDV3130178.1 hypothetical protein [Mycobacterium sp. 21AC1]
MTTEQETPSQYRLIVDRNSVAMGDDVDSHREAWELPGTTSIAELLALMAKRYLPGVGGFAGWRVYQDIGEDGPGWTLGLIYTRDHLRQERYLCLAGEYPRTVADLARRAPLLVVHAAYLTFSVARPVTLSEVAARPSWTGVEAVRSASEADDDAEQDWRLLRRLDALARESQGPRRAWVRAYLQSVSGLADAELFAARNMRSIAQDLCPASMTVAANELLGVDGEHEDVFGGLQPGQAALGVVASVFGAFEWGLSRALRRRQPPGPGVTYLEYLAAHGYQLDPIEQFMSGRIDFDELAAALDDRR